MVDDLEPSPIAALPAALLQSARAEFAAHGFANANVGRIATAAGMSKKTIYKHVASKEALLFAVLGAVVSRPMLSVGSVDVSAGPADRLQAYLVAFATLAFTDEGITSYRIIMSEGPRFPAIARIYMQTVERFGIAPLAAELAAFAAAGRLTIDDADRAARMLMAMVLADPLRDATLGIAMPPAGEAIANRVATSVAIFLQGTLKKRG